jgi:putative RNA 2'-phosphotransferase
VLAVDAERMHADGFEFFVTENHVWLTDHVPPQYLSVATQPE